MNPTRLCGPLTDRALDVLDLAVLEAMVVQALGPTTDALALPAPDPGAGVRRAHLTPIGRGALVEMSVTTAAADLDGWMELLAPGLVEDVVDVVGEDWRAEAELAVELAAAERADDMAAIARLAVAGDLVVDAGRSVGQLLAPRVLDAQLAALIG